MQTQLAPQYRATPEGQEAEAILRKCVHCGFCTATCPTYQLLGDELDGPRGRIYLIKQVLEGETPTRATQPRSKLRTTKGKGMLPALTQDGSQDINKNPGLRRSARRTSRRPSIPAWFSVIPAPKR
jgi:ferredoxin